MTESKKLLQQLTSLKSFHPRAQARRVLVAIAQLGTLKIVAGTIRGNGEAVTETTDLVSAARIVLEARDANAERPRPFRVAVIDVRTDAGVAAARTLRRIDPSLAILALLDEGAAPTRQAMHELGAITLHFPLRSKALLAAIAAAAIPRSFSVAKAERYGFGMPAAEEDLIDTVPSCFPADL